MGCRMWKWLRGAAFRYLRFLIFVGSAGKAVGWLLGYDAVIETWISENRGLMIIIIVLSATIYAIFDWIDSTEI